MSNFAEPATPRDVDELEGTLLPVAQAVPLNMETTPVTTHQQQRPHEATAIPVTSAAPISYFAYDDDDDDNVNGPNNNQNSRTQDQIQDALVIPLVGTFPSCNNEEAQQRQQFALAERTGRIDNDLQKQDIQKVNRKAYAMNYFTKKQMEEANRRASRLSRQEQRQGGWKGPKSELANLQSVAAATAAKSDNKDTQSKQAGTFGKEYDVKEYDVKDYDTNNYEISEYKSIYESWTWHGIDWVIKR